jgi:phospholipase A1
MAVFEGTMRSAASLRERGTSVHSLHRASHRADMPALHRRASGSRRYTAMQSNRLRCAAVAACLVAAHGAYAADPAACATIADDALRLACYDAAFRGEPPAAASAPSRKEAPAAPAPSSTASARQSAERSMLAERWSRYDEVQGQPFLVRLHNTNYLVLRHSDRANGSPVSSPAHPVADADRDVQRDELKFQVSVKARLWATEDRRYAAWLGYTQQSNWQALNAPRSRPFRESDYQPEAMFVVQPDRDLGGGFRWQLLNVGLVHQSNGLSDPASRSWNRVYAQFGVEHPDVAGGRLALLVRPWVRLHERADKDDNPDITDYVGHGDVAIVWRRGEQQLTLGGRLNARTGKGALQLEWSAPATGPFRYYVQAFTGYGESLIDYNFRQTVIGAGFALNDLF